MYKVGVSIGDINGIAPEILLKSHQIIKKFCTPIYCAHQELLKKISEILKIPLAKDMIFIPPNAPMPMIHIGEIQEDSGFYSFKSFEKACELAEKNEVDFITTLPIHKFAWKCAKINFVGHTEYLSHRYKKEGIMMLGCEEMFVALFSDHIPLKSVSNKITKKNLLEFLKNFYHCTKEENIAVLGLNPHCGDNGLIGDEDFIIKESINKINKILNKEIFKGPFPADSAFSPPMREKYKIFIALYHDIGLAPLKALHFYESINITLNIPILRTSVDHGVGFDIAYQNKATTQSYINAILLGKKFKEKNEQSRL